MFEQDKPVSAAAGPSGREWQLLEKVVLEAFQEQKRARRWSIFFKLLTFAYLIALVFLLRPMGGNLGLPGEAGTPGVDHVAVVRVEGLIADGEEANAAAINTGLRNALANKNTRAVILAINSPGGSPVQSGQVHDEIRRLRAEYGSVPIFATISDMGASGAYYIAAAADEIYADKASLVGSIGVISAGFGFVEALDKLGIERRVFSAGENKAFLDAFSPLDKQQTDFWQGVLAETHQQFVDQVRQGRGERLKESPDIFSGLIWTGASAIELGLVDGLGSTRSVARDIVGVEKLVDFTVRPNPFERFVRQMGVAVGEGVASRLSATSFNTPQALPAGR